MTMQEIDKIERLLGMIDERTKSIQHELCNAGLTLTKLSDCNADHESRVLALEVKAKENRYIIKCIGSGLLVVISGIVIYILKAIGFPIT